MIDLFAIVNGGGLIYWTYSLQNLSNIQSSDIINNFLFSYNDGKFQETFGLHRFYWRVNERLGLIYLVRKEIFLNIIKPIFLFVLYS
jgi:hypothetical protein